VKPPAADKDNLSKPATIQIFRTLSSSVPRFFTKQEIYRENPALSEMPT